MDKPSAKQVIEATAISRSHAYDILAEREMPSLPLALLIHSKTGWKHPLIEDLSEATLADLERAQPWAKAA